MKHRSQWHQPLSDDAKSTLWNQAVFVFDTNVLLNLYKFSVDARSQFLGAIGRYRERVWLPNQVLVEFYRNRVSVIDKEVEQYRSISTDLDSATRKVVEDLRSAKRHPFVDDSLIGELETVVQKVRAALGEGKDAQTALLKRDAVLDELDCIFDGKVGDMPDDDALQKLHTEGKVRYAKNLPPGHADKKKVMPDCYGDYLIWSEMLNYGSENKTDVLFVTNDGKEDWWVQGGAKGKEQLMPLPALREEFFTRTNQRFYMLSFDHFIHGAKKDGESVSDEAVEELGEAREAEMNKRVNNSYEVLMREVDRRFYPHDSTLALEAKPQRYATSSQYFVDNREKLPQGVSSFDDQLRALATLQQLQNNPLQLLALALRKAEMLEQGNSDAETAIDSEENG